MILVYFSGATGFTHRFVEKLGLPAVRIPMKIKEASVFEVDEEYVMICPTYELEQVHGRESRSYIPRQVASFLNNKDNRDLLRGVIGAGNRNFYTDFAASADVISKKTGVPTLYRFELAGTEEDVRIVQEGLSKFCQQLK